MLSLLMSIIIEINSSSGEEENFEKNMTLYGAALIGFNLLLGFYGAYINFVDIRTAYHNGVFSNFLWRIRLMHISTFLIGMERVKARKKKKFNAELVEAALHQQ